MPTFIIIVSTEYENQYILSMLMKISEAENTFTVSLVWKKNSVH